MNLLIVFLAQHKAPEVGRVLLESTLGKLSCNKGPKEFLNVKMGTGEFQNEIAPMFHGDK
jgi:hypothetical protein